MKTQFVQVPLSVIFAALVVFGFLAGSTLYFYVHSRTVQTAAIKKSLQFDGEIPAQPADPSTTAVDQNTKPAEPKGRLSYPANIYTVGQGDTLFSVGQKMQTPWQLIAQANGLSDQAGVQAGADLVIPAYYKNTDSYRINFIINDDEATKITQQLKGHDTDPQYDPLAVAKAKAVPYFGLSGDDSYNLVDADLSNGKAVVEAKHGDSTLAIGLVQPRQKGDKGFWGILYIEKE